MRRSRSTTVASHSRSTTASCSATFDADVAQARLRDAHVIAHDFKSLPRLTMTPAEDTMLAAYLIDPGRPAYELDDLAQEYGLEVLPEPATDEETATLVRHAEAARRLAPVLRERLRERGSEVLYDHIELPLAAVLASMEDAGIKIDTYRMGEITARLADRVEELETKAHELAGEEFMLGSTQQVARILFEKLELTPGRKGKTGYSTDTRVLRSIRQDHAIVEVIEEWREYSKLLNTYLQPLPSLLAEDGRLHTHFNQAVASTGRLSTSNPNLQAIPIRTELGREIRSAFVAEPGHKLVSADYSQVELRILAHVSGEPKLRESFARGEDIHTTTAAEVLGKDPATLTKDERNIAKMVNFGIIYGISSYGLSENLEIARDEAQEYIDAYLARFPYVQDFIARTIEQAKRDGYVTTLFGRRRPVPEIRASNRQTRAPRRAARRQLGHAGHGGRHHQGGDGRRSTGGCGRRAARRGSCSRCTTSCSSRRPEREVGRRQGDPARARWWARSSSTRRSRSTSAPATTGTRRSRNVVKRRKGCPWHGRKAGIRLSPVLSRARGAGPKSRGEEPALRSRASAALCLRRSRSSSAGRRVAPADADGAVLLGVHRGLEQQQGARDLQRHRCAGRPRRRRVLGRRCTSTAPRPPA